MERPKIKDPLILDYVEHLEKRLEAFESSPYLSSYLACRTTLNRWNQQLQDVEVNILDAEQKPVFEMCHKYLTEMKPYVELQSYLLDKMTPKEKEDANKIPVGAVAEKFIFDKK